MVIADTLVAVKAELDIASAITTFDTDLTAFVGRGIKRLFPYVQAEMIDETVTIAPGANTFTLPVGLESVRFMYDADGYRVEDFIQHDREIIMSELPAEGTMKIYGNGRFTLATLPEEYEEAVIYYTCALFYSQLAGSKRKYNAYMASGASSVDSMRDMAQWYEERGNTYLQDRGVLLGLE